MALERVAPGLYLTGPEPLSRVLIEASALGVPIAAMNTGGTPDIVVDKRTGLLSNTRGSRETSAGFETTRACDAGSAAAMARAVELFDAAATTERIEASVSDLVERRAVTQSLRVAIVARSVYPLHGHGGLERHVYDLTRYLADAGIQVTLITREPKGEPGSERAAHAISPEAQADYGPLSDLPTSRTTRTTVIDRSTAYPLFGERAGRVALDLVKRQEVDVVHGFGASVLGHASAPLSAPLVMNLQGLEEFGATDPGRARLKRVGTATPEGRARLRQSG
jgi:glycosyltransferase involved in cell wall biosynthesis